MATTTTTTTTSRRECRPSKYTSQVHIFVFFCTYSLVELFLEIYAHSILLEYLVYTGRAWNEGAPGFELSDIQFYYIWYLEIIWPLNSKERHLLYPIHAFTAIHLTFHPAASRHEARSHATATTLFCTLTAVDRCPLLAPPIPPDEENTARHVDEAVGPPVGVCDGMQHVVRYQLDQRIEPTGHTSDGGGVQMQTGPGGIGQVDQNQSQHTRQTFGYGAVVGVRDRRGECSHGEDKVQGEGVAEMVEGVG